MKKRKEGMNINEEHFIPPPYFYGKNEYLYHFDAPNCIKEKVRWRHNFWLV